MMNLYTNLNNIFQMNKLTSAILFYQLMGNASRLAAVSTRSASLKPPLAD